MFRFTLTAIPSSQGRSDPPSGRTVRCSRQASRKLRETAASAADQSPLCLKAWLYTARQCSSNSAPNASVSPARTRARSSSRLSSIRIHCPPAATWFPRQARRAHHSPARCPIRRQATTSYDHLMRRRTCDYAAAAVFGAFFAIGGLVTTLLSPGESAALRLWASTNVANLRHHPVPALVLSAFLP